MVMLPVGAPARLVIVINEASCWQLLQWTAARASIILGCASIVSKSPPYTRAELYYLIPQGPTLYSLCQGQKVTERHH